MIRYKLRQVQCKIKVPSFCPRPIPVSGLTGMVRYILGAKEKGEKMGGGAEKEERRKRRGLGEVQRGRAVIDNQ